MRSPTLLTAFTALVLAPASILATPVVSDPRLGAVASETSECSHIGTQILKAGGNAADSMIATVFCVGTIGMYHSGIGGGGFLLVRSPKGKYEFVDFRETAPAASSENMYKNKGTGSTRGGLASGIPGELRGLEYLHKHYGKLPWRDLLAPSIKLARDGFVVNADLVRYMDMEVDKPGDGGFFVSDPSWAVDFAPNGRRVRLGETMTRKRYAKTLQRIADEGPGVFYRGDMAQATIKALQATGGIMTLQDLAGYQIKLRRPAGINYRGYKLTATSAPSGGGVALAILNVLNGYKDFGHPSAVNQSTHRLNEAMRFAYAQRAKLGDPAFVNGTEKFQRDMLSGATGQLIRSKISDAKTQDTAYYNPEGLESLETPGTSHIAVADASGMAVSLTTTINTFFGSHVMVPETGVPMNNNMDDFSVPGMTNSFGYLPSPANFIRPGKRPLSSMSPLIAEVRDGKRLYFVLGAAGGSRIITSTVQNVIHVLDEGKTAPQALAMPRLHDQLTPAVTTFEWAYNNATVQYLKNLGHNVSWVAPGQSTAQAVRLLPNGTFEAAGEPRQLNSGGYAV
ncbi:gamma-glutamyltransferase [Pyricularia oryzae 70-15]|uniref:Glutathione hydrolase n=1 Tax=Pyricularia oryzae (strain 70-15 / ATCC MYA-4617 / FGSC 8958) TaxID=242507 RepID=G4MNT3_PYRO7|nr:gamma-glutamyltransferase [Pyricularia oryzae 70-15]EHA56299.1 gamma-glutamyltransferase [Pyricularia oryzae 70-15]KAI7911972.1 gamma-glutamyltransferase [Pyricularia oryzae]